MVRKSIAVFLLAVAPALGSGFEACWDDGNYDIEDYATTGVGVQQAATDWYTTNGTLESCWDCCTNSYQPGNMRDACGTYCQLKQYAFHVEFMAHYNKWVATWQPEGYDPLPWDPDEHEPWIPSFSPVPDDALCRGGLMPGDSFGDCASDFIAEHIGCLECCTWYRDPGGSDPDPACADGCRAYRRSDLAHCTTLYLMIEE